MSTAMGTVHGTLYEASGKTASTVFFFAIMLALLALAAVITIAIARARRNDIDAD